MNASDRSRHPVHDSARSEREGHDAVTDARPGAPGAAAAAMSRSPALPTSLALSAAGGLAFGGLTQLGQSYLPDWLHSLANSGAPWMLIAFAFALLCRTPWAAGVAGVLTLAGLEIGYIAVAAVRDFPSALTTVAFWLTAAVVIGPMAGLAAYCLRVRSTPWGAVGGGLVAGIVSGEGLASYLTVRDTTTPGYWVGQVIVGLLLVGLVGRRTGFAWAVAAFAVGVAALLGTRAFSMVGA